MRRLNGCSPLTHAFDQSKTAFRPYESLTKACINEKRVSALVVTKRLVPASSDAESPKIFSAGKLEHVGVLGRRAPDETVLNRLGIRRPLRLSLEQEERTRPSALVETAGDVSAFGREQGAHPCAPRASPMAFRCDDASAVHLGIWTFLQKLGRAPRAPCSMTAFASDKSSGRSMPPMSFSIPSIQRVGMMVEMRRKRFGARRLTRITGAGQLPATGDRSPPCSHVLEELSASSLPRRCATSQPW